MSEGAGQDHIYGAEHDIGFMVAGARGDVLNDFRSAIESFIEKGHGIEKFRADFDDIVKRRGWAYNSGRNWRTRVIYETNLRQSYHAGREAQMADPELRKLRPYGLYRHGGSSDPRPEHLALNGTVLPLDDPWWDTWSPMNGWGCTCKKFTLSKADVERLGLKVLDKAPESVMETRTIGVRGPSPREVTVPKGIDPGFEHRPGANRIGVAAERYMSSLANMDPIIAASTFSSQPLRERALGALTVQTKQFIDQYFDRGRIHRNEFMHVGVISLPTMRALEERRRLPESAGIILHDADLAHVVRDTKAKRGVGLLREQFAEVPSILANPQAVLWDLKKPALIYAFALPDTSAKLVVKIDYVDKVLHQDGSRERLRVNKVRTGGILERHNLLDTTQYEILSGDFGKD